jgi:hypothetical protein
MKLAEPSPLADYLASGIGLPPALSSIDRRPGHEVAFAELVDRRTTDAAGLMSQARRYYLAHASTLGHEPVAWEELSVLTVRAWVAVAREAIAVHGGGR